MNMQLEEAEKKVYLARFQAEKEQMSDEELGSKLKQENSDFLLSTKLDFKDSSYDKEQFDKDVKYVFDFIKRTPECQLGKVFRKIFKIDLEEFINDKNYSFE